ncbi:unnamed protein product [Ascophyllum nodosum]
MLPHVPAASPRCTSSRCVIGRCLTISVPRTTGSACSSATPRPEGHANTCAQRKLRTDGRQYVLNQAVERFRLLKVVKSTPYTVMDVEVGIPDDKPAEGEPTKWGADEGTRLGDLEMQLLSEGEEWRVRPERPERVMFCRHKRTSAG